MHHALIAQWVFFAIAAILENKNSSGKSLRGSTSVYILSKMHCMHCFLRFIGNWKEEKVMVSKASSPE